MPKIIKIEETVVKIAKDDDNVISVPIATLTYSSPKIGDEVKVYKDGNNFIVEKAKGTMSGEGAVKCNKHLFVWVFAFLLGGLGADRFVRGQVGIGVCKILFNWITFGIWFLVDWIVAIVKAYATSFKDDDDFAFSNSGEYLK